ncbi:hypothetical protein EXIGLDRAFT_639431 [Exidia glandulosa HHB12029]|uniref:DNA/RNA-binding domain-containing protein n=1 Tax=Exidia glandulosa HHB12029 TaxID=1314781 RepID=A0A165N8H5_EXIGL|nr:hypothetical protein EXIGLDRAFT_639431 [Exidia glandulosa HHB12029]
MWLETSHQFISSYKDKLGQLDKIISAPPESRPPSRNRHGPVEYRKLAQRFRQFLAEEEKFWIAFVTRFVRLFSLDEARPALTMLGIAVGDLEPEASPSANGHARSRSHLFPDEGDPYAVPANQRAERLLILSKALVCIGDIARYREQWNESGGRPRAGKETHDEVPRRGGRSGRREPAPRPRNYARARDCYEQARAMFPDSGNSSHQLAILASYEADAFNSFYHYYRALCVRNPYTAALENMEKSMGRFLETHLPGYKLTRPVETEELTPRVQVDNFKESLLILHSLWRSDDVEKYDLPLFSDVVVRQLESQVTERVLPSDLITKTTVIAIGALWTHRIYRGSNARESSRRASLETLILGHILDVFRTLMQIGISQLADTTRTPADTALDIAQHITAVLRRMLPALRICTKWLISNLDSICGPDAPSGPELSDTAAKLWDSYIDFASLLLRVFPLDTLPPMRAPLEEDVDMTGFAPLKKLMQSASVATNGLAVPQSEVHPNEEQLMRIRDLLRDAIDIGTKKDSPIAYVAGKFVLKNKDVYGEPASSPLDFIPSSVAAWRATQKVQQEVKPVDEPEDDARTVSTRTEDDPVRLAMNATLDDDDDDDEEQILYPKNMMTPSRTHARPVIPSPISPLSRPQLHNRTSSTTATDLVNSLLGGRHLNEPAPQPAAPLLFGASPSRTSIWSTSHDTSSPAPLPNGAPSFSQQSLPTQTQTSWAPSLNPASPTRAYFQQSPAASAFPPTTVHPHFTSMHAQSPAPYAQYPSPMRQPIARPRTYYDSPTMADPYNPFPVQQHHPAPYPVQGPVMQSRPWS